MGLSIASCEQTISQSSTVQENTNNTPIVFNKTIPPHYSTISYNNNIFALKLFEQLEKNNTNVFFSPFSIYDALTIAYEGAKGKSAEEMHFLLGIPNNDKTTESQFSEVLSDLKGNPNYQLKIANAIWPKIGLVINKSYKERIEKYFHSTVQNVDLGSNDGTNIIEQWIKNHTNNKISINIKPDPLMDMVITNAIYFKGSWANRFDKSLTKKQDFYVTPKKTIKVDMMHFSESHKLKYANRSKYEALDLPYKGSNLSMLIILPNKPYGIDDINISSINIADLESVMHKNNVIVDLPKFSYRSYYLLNKALKNMGMISAFYPKTANFSGSFGNFAKDIYIGKVLHDAYVNVTEQGTEAAAVTVITQGTTAAPPREVSINHPFLFFIIDNNTNLILFMGKVVEPTGTLVS